MGGVKNWICKGGRWLRVLGKKLWERKQTLPSPGGILPPGASLRGQIGSSLSGPYRGLENLRNRAQGQDSRNGLRRGILRERIEALTPPVSSVCFCASASQSLSLSLCISDYVSVFVCLCVSVSISLCHSMSPSLSLYLCVSLSLCFYLYFSMPLFRCVFLPLCFCLSVSLCAFGSPVSIFVSLFLCVCLSVYLSLSLCSMVLTQCSGSSQHQCTPSPRDAVSPRLCVLPGPYWWNPVPSQALRGPTLLPGPLVGVFCPSWPALKAQDGKTGGSRSGSTCGQRSRVGASSCAGSVGRDTATL